MSVSGNFFLCYFETTRRCNLHCSHCMTRRESSAEAPEMSTEEAKTRVLDEVSAISSNAAIAFSGGEHLLRPDAYELLEYAGKLGIWSFINTNGRLLMETDAVRQASRATGGKAVFALSLNSLDACTNCCGRDDSPETVWRAAERCEKEHAPFFFIVTVSKGNLATLPETVKFLRKRNVPMLRSPFVPRGAGGAFRHLMIDRADMERTLHPALTGNPLSYISFTPFFGSPDLIEAGASHFALRIAGAGCQAARSFAAVSAEGQVAPCVHLLDSSCACGNVRTERLSEVIRDAPLFAALRSRAGLKGKCGRCRYRQTCGGCRAQAFYHSGDVEGEDPTCFFEPSDPRARSCLETAQTAQLGRFLFYVKTTTPWSSFL